MVVVVVLLLTEAYWMPGTHYQLMLPPEHPPSPAGDAAAIRHDLAVSVLRSHCADDVGWISADEDQPHSAAAMVFDQPARVPVGLMNRNAPLSPVVPVAGELDAAAAVLAAPDVLAAAGVLDAAAAFLAAAAADVLLAAHGAAKVHHLQLSKTPHASSCVAVG